MRHSRLAALLALGLGLLISSSAVATNYDESINGDLSNDRLNPTALTLTQGSNMITATSMAGDIEYFRLTVPAGKRLSAVVVVGNTSASLSFIAVQAGNQFTEPPTGTVVGNLLGYSHFGVGNGTIGTDILDNIGTGAGAIGFVPPLAAGNYTFWSQETSSTPSTYTLDFQVTAAPTQAPIPRAAFGVLAAALGAVGAWLSRRRRAAA